MVTIETETREDAEEVKRKSDEDDPDPDPEPAPGHQQHCVGNAAVARNNPRLRRLFTLEEEEEEVEDSFEDYYIMDTQRNV